MRFVQLSDVCDLQNGFAFKSTDYVEKSNTCNIRMSNIRPGGSFNEFHNERYLPDSYAKEYKDYLLNDGDLIIAMTDMATETKILGLPTLVNNTSGRSFLLNQRVGKLCKFSKDIYVPYLRHILTAQDVIDYYKSKGAGGLQINISKKDILSVKFPLPAIPTQQKIVAKLDAIFAEIEIATAAGEANAKNAEALFQSYLTEVFERSGEGWFELRLQDLLDKGWIVSHLDGNHGDDYPRKEEFISSGVPYISANCLDGDILDLSKSKFLSKERASKLRKGLAKTDDVLFAHNATVGPVSILKTMEEVTILGTSLTYYRCNKEFIEPEYLANYMRSAKFKNQYLTIMRQSTRNQIPITKQREFFHVIPPLEQQKELLKKFNIFLSMKTVYESKASKKINELFLLKKSILKQAFSGELVKE